jgi:hypothetical protein
MKRKEALERWATHVAGIEALDQAPGFDRWNGFVE